MPTRANTMASPGFRPSISFPEHIHVTFGMLVVTDVINGIVRPCPTCTDINPISAAAILYVLIVSAAFSLVKWRDSLYVLAGSKLVVLFFLLVLASSTWSAAPDLTLRRSIPLLSALLFALYLVIRFDTATNVILVGRAYLLIVISSAAMALFVPSIGVMTRDSAPYTWTEELDGAWNGVFSHKNILGWVVISTMQIYMWRFLHETTRRWYLALVLLILGFVMFMTRSTTAVVAVILSVSLFCILQIERWETNTRRLAFILVLFTALSVIVTLLSAGEQLTESIGKNASLTGRVPLWYALLDFVAKRPLSGYGYTAFFEVNNTDFLQLWANIGWNPSHAHNAYLQLLVELGLPGMLLGTAIMLSIVFGSLRLYRSGVTWAEYVAVFSIVFAITNIVETRLLRYGDNYCLMVAMFYMSLARHEVETISMRYRRNVRPPTPQFQVNAFHLRPDQEAENLKNGVTDVAPGNVSRLK